MLIKKAGYWHEKVMLDAGKHGKGICLRALFHFLYCQSTWVAVPPVSSEGVPSP